jgi:2-deoxy-D-gluconate 3-dehydrogenase
VESIEALFGLRGRGVLVTGAGRGLGRGLALAAASAGATVVAVSRTAAELDETAALAAPAMPGGILPLPWDVADVERMDDLVAEAARRLGPDAPIVGVVHAAGVQHRALAVDFTVADWDRVTRLDLDAPFFLSTAVHRRGGGASHVFVGSLTTSIGIINTSAYAASKAGLAGIVRTLAVEWAGTGARVNALCPGYFHTELTAALFADPQRSAWVHSRIPMGRLGVADDLAGAAVFLLSSASGYVTGLLLNVDGGWLAA